MTFRRRAAIAAMALFVSGCGGGGSSGSNPVTLAPGGNTPTPTPTPPPSPTYATYSDALADLTMGPPFALSQATRNTATGVYSQVDAGIQPGMVEAGFSGRPSITAHFADFVRNKFSNFTAADVAFQNVQGFLLERRNADFSSTSMGVWHPTETNYIYQYFASINVRHSYAAGSGHPDELIELTYDFLTGSRTVASDLPTPIDMTYYSLFMSLNGIITLGAVPSQMTGNLTLSKTGVLDGKFPYTSSNGNGTTTTFLAIIKGSMDQQTQHISGDITGENGAYAGKFEGYLYGPKGQELAFLVYMKNASGTIATSGVIIGHR
jgi:hypothetical protein